MTAGKEGEALSDRPAERVLVVPRISLFPKGAYEGFIPELPGDTWERISGDWRFVDRARAEADPSLKQIIPYTVLKGDGGYFLYRRLDAGGEKRLHGRYSIGLGGHLAEEDVREGNGGLPLAWLEPVPGWIGSAFGAVIARGLSRELAEEVEIGRGVLPVRFLGAINDEVVPVARVHFGLVFQAELGQAAVAVSRAERDQLSGAFVPLERVMEYWDKLEGWSQILSRALQQK